MRMIYGTNTIIVSDATAESLIEAGLYSRSPESKVSGYIRRLTEAEEKCLLENIKEVSEKPKRTRRRRV